MPMKLEPINRPVAGPSAFLRDLSAENAVNALVAFAFSISGPVAIILAVTARGGLSEAQTASWIFGSFFINGLLSIAFCAAYRQPLVFFWTIPGTVLVGPALAHASFNEVVGAFLVTGLLMLALGLSGVVRRVMDAVPMPIVMGMVAGVFLPFGLDWVKAFESDLAIALPMTLTFLGLSALPNVARRLPPLIIAMAVGVFAIALTRAGALPPIGADAILAAPVVVTPHFNPATLIELVVPLAITVLVVQNGQGIAVLRSVGHEPPINAIAAACGMWSLFAGIVGSVSTCLTGPTNAILATGRDKHTHYAAGILVGILGIAFGLFSPLFTKLLLATPPAFIATLAGLAMLRVLQGAFATAFQGAFGIGALVAFLVTVSGIAIAGIGAPFWGLVFGAVVSRVLERGDFAARAAEKG
jgi:benzoate membrane transport protein